MGETEKTFSCVHILHIPENIKEISIQNDIFPNLEEIEVDLKNPVYSTDGKMLFKTEKNHKSIINSRKNNKVIRIMDRKKIILLL